MTHQFLSPYTDADPANCPEVCSDPNSAICRTTAVTATGRYITNASTTERLSLAGWNVARPGADDHKAFRSRGF